MCKKSPVITRSALNALMRYNYPGNIRELENILQRIIIMNDSELIDFDHLPSDIQEYPNHTSLKNSSINNFKEAKQKIVEQFEKEYIYGKLRECHGVIIRAARKAGMCEANFRRKMDKYGIIAKANF